jgi:hypothetical protein
VSSEDDIRTFCVEVIKLLQAEQTTLEDINRRLDALDRALIDIALLVNRKH